VWSGRSRDWARRRLELIELTAEDALTVLGIVEQRVGEDRWERADGIEPGKLLGRELELGRRATQIAAPCRRSSTRTR